MAKSSVFGPSKIQRYNDMTTQARINERKADWSYAARMWRMALAIAEEMHWKSKIAWCSNRAAFCDGVAKRTAS